MNKMLSSEQIAHDLTLLEIQTIINKDLVPTNAEFTEDGKLKLNFVKLYADIYPSTLKDVDHLLKKE